MGVVKVVARDLGIPLLIGCILFALRDLLTQKWCAVTPSPCVPDSVNALDRIVFQFGSIRADFASNVFQNALIALIVTLPFLIAATRRISWRQAIRDLLGFVTIATWNFMLMEILRTLVQRPRPLVYRAPLEDGANIYQYNSFYSGHTSFAALATLSLYFYAVRLAPGRTAFHRIILAAAVVAPLVMGALRVYGGRHYPTDVLAGAFIGWALAWAYEKYRKGRPPLSVEA